MQTLPINFSLILAGLQAIIAEIASKDRTRTAFLVFVHSRLNRTRQRFERLFARWKNGTLPKPRAARPVSARPVSARPVSAQPASVQPTTARTAAAPAFRLPRGRAWLLRQLAHYNANGRRTQFRYLLATPELREFLVAAPQAGRLLRPLCQMLGVKLDAPFGVPLPPAPAPAAAFTPPPASPEAPPPPAPPVPGAQCAPHPIAAAPQPPRRFSAA